MAQVVRAALVQATWTGDTESMIAKHEEHARRAAARGAKVIGFQEVFNAPYFCQVQEPEHYRWAEPVPDGPTVRRMQELARETGMVIVVPVFELEAEGFYYNTAAVIDADGSYLGKYRKHHIPQVKGFWEKYYFRPGNLGWPVFDTAVGKVGVYICYDRHFPEAGARWAWPEPAGLQPVRHLPRPVRVPVAAGTARLRRRQRVLRRRHQPRRTGGVRRQRLLRHQLLRRPARPVRRRGRQRQGGGTPRPGPRLRPDQGGPRPVGLLPRPPPRRLRRTRTAVTNPIPLHSRHAAVLPDWLALYYDRPIELTHGEGRHVWDADGNRYLDFFGGILTTMTAHALPEVTKAVSEQPAGSSTPPPCTSTGR